MIFFKRKINIKNKLSQNSGFTLIETIVAVLVLTISLSALLNLTANSAVTSRYSRNDITVNYLLQEVIDFIRNDRDTIAFQQGNLEEGGWDSFINKYNQCFDPKVCIIEPMKDQINECSGDCPFLNYRDDPVNTGFYTYDNTGVKSIFQRTVKMSYVDYNEDEIKIEVILNWNNNGVDRSRTMTSNILNWQVNY